MRDGFSRKVPSMRDKIDGFPPSMRDFWGSSLCSYTFYLYLQQILKESRHNGKGVFGALF